MKHTRVQIVGPIPGDVSRRVRAAAKLRTLIFNALLIEALTPAAGGPRPANPPEPST